MVDELPPVVDLRPLAVTAHDHSAAPSCVTRHTLAR
jgi:hypothetical protein